MNRVSTLHRAPVGQGPPGPDWLAIVFGFWSGRALATGQGGNSDVFGLSALSQEMIIFFARERDFLGVFFSSFLVFLCFWGCVCVLFGGVFFSSRVNAIFFSFFFFGVALIIFFAKPSKAGNPPPATRTAGAGLCIIHHHQHPPPCARGPGASAPTAGQGLGVLVFAGACRGTAWVGLCLIHHHHPDDQQRREFPQGRLRWLAAVCFTLLTSFRRNSGEFRLQRNSVSPSKSHP